MYNRYIPGADGYTRVVVEEPRTQHRAHQRTREETTTQENRAHKTEKQDPLGDFVRNIAAPLRILGGEDKNAGMAGILKSLHLEDVDSGDLLLLLIILLLLLEGDSMELVITLGLMLVLSLGDEKQESQNE